MNFTKDGTPNVTIQITPKKLDHYGFFSSYGLIENEAYSFFQPHIELP
jgi:hypothetical protein